MTTKTTPNPHSDAAKARGPAELRNPDAQRKAPDMPEDEGRHHRDPEKDYPPTPRPENEKPA